MASSQQQHHLKYDVFLSFRGPDTRLGFTDHLYEALVRAGIFTFRDDDEIEKGCELKLEIETAIKSSRASIIILSKTYAVSRWCLNELSLIMEEKKARDHYVLPVFYHVEPSDIRNYRDRFNIKAEDQQVEGSKWTEDSVKRWKKALRDVGKLKGIVASRPETELIAEIVGTIIHELDLKLLSIPANLIGMETRAESIGSWLKHEQSKAKLLAIYGMGGAGKTTLAKYLYNSHKQHFDSSCFLEKIGERSKGRNGLLELQKQLLEDISGGMNKMISNVFEGATKIAKVLARKKVFIVLDDIDESTELDVLLGTRPVNTLAVSKVILTTRLLDINGLLEPESWSYVMFPLDLLNEQESLAVFSYHAFGSNVPMGGFTELAVELAKYCGGNPLALKVLGRSLTVSNEDKSEDTIVEMWKSRLRSLKSMKGDLDCRIQVILQISFDSLPLNYEKELFLHIACFFVGEYKDYVQEILEHDYHAKSGIRTLVNKCLITISQSGDLMMHQLLQDMGRCIVRSTDASKCRRVWDDDESYYLLTDEDHVKEDIEALSLDIRKLKEGIAPSGIKTDSLVKMKKLKFLMLSYVELKGSYEGFSKLRNLRFLLWHGCNITKLPSGLLMSSLVVLDMRHGHLKKFEPPTVLASLKILNLIGSQRLVSVGNLWLLPKLEFLNLQCCHSLTRVCETIKDLKSLVTLNLTCCGRLACSKIRKQPLFFLPPSLKHLLFSNCGLKYNTIFHVGVDYLSLFRIDLSRNTFEFLPDNIDLKTLRVLKLTSCPNLKSLCLPSKLEELNTDFCTSLEKITFQSTRYELKRLTYRGCTKLTQVQGLFKLVSVEKLDEADLGYFEPVKALQHHNVDLVGDEITQGRKWNIQMLYEYGITSTFLQDIDAQSIDIVESLCEFVTSSTFLQDGEMRKIILNMPPCTMNIQGLHVTFGYRSSGEDEDNDEVNLLAKISILKSTTKVLTWVYNPLVYCKPRVDEDVAWISYWPIGNMLDDGDEVFVEVLGKNLMPRIWGFSLVYMGSEQVEKEENYVNNSMKEEDVIGGDLSEFEVTTGGYYLCRRNLFNPLDTASTLQELFRFDDGVYDSLTGKLGWREHHVQGRWLVSNTDPKIHGDTLLKVIILGEFSNETEERKMLEVVYNFDGIILAIFTPLKETTKLALNVFGHFDHEKLTTHLREFDNMVRILHCEYKIGIVKYVFDGLRSAHVAKKTVGYFYRHPILLLCIMVLSLLCILLYILWFSIYILRRVRMKTI